MAPSTSAVIAATAMPLPKPADVARKMVDSAALLARGSETGDYREHAHGTEGKAPDRICVGVHEEHTAPTIPTKAAAAMPAQRFATSTMPSADRESRVDSIVSRRAARLVSGQQHKHGDDHDSEHAPHHHRGIGA